MILTLLSAISAASQTSASQKPALNVFDKISAPEQSFVLGIQYNQLEMLSNKNWKEECAYLCKNSPSCLGFFEQTHKCPQPLADDRVSNPNSTPEKGCYRICGFYDKGESPLGKTLSEGPVGSVWALKQIHGFKKISSINQSFIKNIKYTQFPMPSNINWVKECAMKCKRDSDCLGFFEQTHLCPEPFANDLTSDPNVTEGKGCYRICSLYNLGESPLGKAFVSGPNGSVWARLR